MFLIYFRNGDWSNTRLTVAPSVKCTYNNQGIKETHKKEIFLKPRVKTLHKQFRHFETFKCFGDLQFYFLRAFDESLRLVTNSCDISRPDKSFGDLQFYLLRCYIKKVALWNRS